MGKIEEKAGKRKRKRDFQRAILMTVQVVGLTALAVLPTNLPVALQKLGMLPLDTRSGGIVNRARNRLLKKGLLRKDKNFLVLTAEGERFLHRSELRQPDARPRRWDGRWRVLMFDIPENKKVLREKIRRTLITAGFARLQNSVWIFPYDVEDFVAVLKADLHIGKEMLYLVVDELEADTRLRKYFELPAHR